jgi:formate-dependent phosphoribosylglycinamide formyltransferase (GAR transformylase)
MEEDIMAQVGTSTSNNATKMLLSGLGEFVKEVAIEA